MRIITLLTDFGLDDDEAMLLKGVILNIASEVRIADLTHAVPPQDIRTGSQILGRSFHYFPDGSIHVAVVDPGVGTSRRGMAARIGPYYVVGPDNGLFTEVYLYARMMKWQMQFVSLTNPRFHLKSINPVFHGRDIFAPVAAHLARGIDLLELGEPFSDPVTFAE